MTIGTIEFACPYCEKVTRVPADYGGKQGKCPGCERVIEVPMPEAGVSPAEQATVYEPPPAGAIGSAVTGAHAAPPPMFEYRHGQQAVAPVGGPVDAPAVVGGDTRPCPACGEQIKSAAKKCKFCGEFLDERLRAQRRAPALDVGRLASPWTRLAAAFLDNLLVMTPVSMLVVGGVVLLDQRNMAPLGGGLMLLALLIMVAYHAYSWYLIATTGQNITKRWLRIKIVKIDGGPVDFVSGVLLRNWVYSAVNLVPYIGGCFWWAGFLFIFAQDRRCLHDHIASTVVVEV